MRKFELVVYSGSKLLMCQMLVLLVQEFKLTGNLNLSYFISQVLRCQGVGRSKCMYFRASEALAFVL